MLKTRSGTNLYQQLHFGLLPSKQAGPLEDTVMRWDIRHRDEMLDVVAVGQARSVATPRVLPTEVAEALRQHPAGGICLDFREAPSALTKPGALKIAASAANLHLSLPIAVLVRPQRLLSGEFLSGIASSFGCTVRTFTDPERASRWLRSIARSREFNTTRGQRLPNAHRGAELWNLRPLFEVFREELRGPGKRPYDGAHDFRFGSRLCEKS